MTSQAELIRVDHDHLVADLHLELRKHQRGTLLEPMVHAKMTVVALTQVAAIVAVDCLMDEEQFLNVCKANFQEAYKRAPRWT